MNRPQDTGQLDSGYAESRSRKSAPKYRLWRRTREVLAAIETYGPSRVGAVLDLGTADGRMLDTIRERFPDARCVGVEYNPELASLARRGYPHLTVLRGDVQALGLADRSFDVAIATAVLEHVPDLRRAIQEAARVLRPGGLFVATVPDPFWDRLATKVGHLDEDQHHQQIRLGQLTALLAADGFEVVKAQKFMLSPVGMPFEFAVERSLRFMRLGFLLANQLAVARNANSSP